MKWQQNSQSARRWNCNIKQDKWTINQHSANQQQFPPPLPYKIQRISANSLTSLSPICTARNWVIRGFSHIQKSQASTLYKRCCPCSKNIFNRTTLLTWHCSSCWKWSPPTSKHTSHWCNKLHDMLKLTFHDFLNNILDFNSYISKVCGLFL